MTNNPTTPELLAAAAGLSLHLRNVIELVDRANPAQVNEALNAIHEHIAVMGGSILFVAKRLGCEAEVERRIKEGQNRVKVAQSFAGKGGRA